MWRVAKVLLGHAYWTGVRKAVGTHSAWLRFRTQTEASAREPREVKLDIDSDLDCLDAIFERDWAEAVHVLWRGASIGRIEAVPGAERLAGRHLRKLLIDRFPGPMLGVLVDRQLRGAPADTQREPLVQHSV